MTPAARIETGTYEGGDLYSSPHAGQVPVPGTAAIILGHTIDGQAVILATTSIAWLDQLDAAIREARAQGIVEAGMEAPVMSDTRTCPECGEPQEWCNSPDCFLPPGHWTHTGDENVKCDNLGDRNREPGKPPFNAWQYMPGMERS